jgi:hypothetical protein
MSKGQEGPSWPPTSEERAAAKMRDAAFLLLLRAWLLRERLTDEERFRVASGQK